MKMTYSVGIDIGGTKVNIGIVKDTGDILRSRVLPSNKEVSPESFVALICGEIRSLLEEESLSIEDIGFFGVGVPGTADIGTGMVSYCPNLSWFDVPIGELFKRYLEKDVKVMQDSRNAALAEFLLGAGREYKSILCVTLGTGIGGGIIIDGKIYGGALNTAGEIGHTPIVKDGYPCVCGNRGCLENYFSGTGIPRQAKRMYPEKFAEAEKVSCEKVFDLAYSGDKEMLDLIAKGVDNLAFGIANAVSILAPEAVIISGGLCVHDELIIQPLRRKVIERGYYSWTRLNRLVIKAAELGENAPMLGAALLYKGI